MTYQLQHGNPHHPSPCKPQSLHPSIPLHLLPRFPSTLNEPHTGKASPEPPPVQLAVSSPKVRHESRHVRFSTSTRDRSELHKPRRRQVKLTLPLLEVPRQGGNQAMDRNRSQRALQRIHSVRGIPFVHLLDCSGESRSWLEHGSFRPDLACASREVLKRQSLQARKQVLVRDIEIGNVRFQSAVGVCWAVGVEHQVGEHVAHGAWVFPNDSHFFFDGFLEGPVACYVEVDGSFGEGCSVYAPAEVATLDGEVGFVWRTEDQDGSSLVLEVGGGGSVAKTASPFGDVFMVQDSCR